MRERKREHVRKNHPVLILTIGFVLALCLILYPVVSTIYNNYVESKLIVEYTQSVADIDNELYEQLLEEARAWNEELFGYIEPSYFPEGMTQNEIYESLLDPLGTGMMGYVVIPKIDVDLPIYHYSTDEVLEKGAGHMEASALPVGGESTHCVITAHRGLPGATMFTDLDKLEIGDVFYLKVLGEMLCYQIIEIQTVDPDETASLLPEQGKDLCTLVTCTPYGINSQRLLVTGERIEIEEEEVETSDTGAIQKGINSNILLIIIAGAEVACYATIMILMKKKKKKKKSIA